MLSISHMDDTKGETSAHRGESESEMSEVKLFLTTLLALLRTKPSSAQSYETLRSLSGGRSCKNPDCSGQVEPWSGLVYCKGCRTAHHHSLGDGSNEMNKSESVGGRKFPRDEARRGAGTGRARPPGTAARAPGAPGAAAAPEAEMPGTATPARADTAATVPRVAPFAESVGAMASRDGVNAAAPRRCSSRASDVVSEGQPT